MLEQHSSASPRKERRAVRDVIERVEAALDSIDDAWCEAMSQSNELKLAARLFAEVQSSTEDSSGVDVSSGLVELLDCLDRCGGVRGGASAAAMDQAPPVTKTPPPLPRSPQRSPRRTSTPAPAGSSRGPRVTPRVTARALTPPREASTPAPAAKPEPENARADTQTRAKKRRDATRELLALRTASRASESGGGGRSD